jgi:hypothetical protein
MPHYMGETDLPDDSEFSPSSSLLTMFIALIICVSIGTSNVA